MNSDQDFKNRKGMAWSACNKLDRVWQSDMYNRWNLHQPPTESSENPLEVTRHSSSMAISIGSRKNYQRGGYSLPGTVLETKKKSFPPYCSGTPHIPTVRTI